MRPNPMDRSDRDPLSLRMWPFPATRMLTSAAERGGWHRLAVLAAAGLLAGPTLGVLAAVSVTYVQIDANGPPKAWGKGAGDLNGDGRADLLIGSIAGGLYWYQNPGWTKRTISAGIKAEEDLEVVDLDKDGRQDVVAVTTNAVTWFENNGGGTSWTAHTLDSGLDLHDLEVADFDGDGKLDLAGRDQYPQGATVQVWRQISLTNWAPSTIANVETGTGLTAVDLNRDGKIDLATNKYWMRNTSRNGAISFERILYNSAAEKDAYVTSGRIDGDAYPDLLVTPAHPTISGTHHVSWYENPGSGNGVWARRVVESGVQSVVHFAAVADFNGDGRNDITTAMTHLGTNPKIKIYYNEDGNGSFSDPDTVANASSHMMQIVDVAGKRSLYGADYNDAGRTSVDLWQINSATNTPPSNAPVATDDAASTAAGTAVTISVLANDTGTNLAVASVTTPANGTTRITSNNGSVVYTPDSGFSGTDTFRYTLRDGSNRTDTGTVTVTVRGSTTTNPVYLGCFRDQGTVGSTNGRDLSGFLLADRTSMTQALCNSTCRSRGYDFAGTQAGYQCFCGNRYGSFGTATNCTTPCAGDDTKRCGGSWANSVFDLR